VPGESADDFIDCPHCKWIIDVAAARNPPGPVLPPILPRPRAALPIPAAPATRVDDEIIHQDKCCRITTAVVSINGTTYALRNINSVSAKKKEVGTGTQLCAFLGILLGLGFFSGGVVGVIIGLCLIALIVCWAWQENQKHLLAFDTSSGAITGLESKDHRYVKDLADKIETAMRRR
jgi:hypothetical protein